MSLNEEQRRSRRRNIEKCRSSSNDGEGKEWYSGTVISCIWCNFSMSCESRKVMTVAMQRAAHGR